MATKSNFATLVFVVATAMALLKGAEATVYFVGDNLGWTIPTGGAAVYANWSSQHNFTTGDILVFNFNPGQHDVAKVTKDAFDTCSSTNPISILTLSPANFTLSEAGEQHFICTFGQHCLGGQKLSVSVSSTSASPPPATSPSPSPSPSMAPSPAPSAATSPPPQSPPTTSPSPSPSPSMAPSPTPSPSTSPPPQSPATSPSPTPSSTPPAGTTSPPPPPATASMPSPPSETPPPPPSSAPRKFVASTFTVMSIALGVMF